MCQILFEMFKEQNWISGGGILPLDSLVADDDGWEEEDNWGTAHRGENYNVHLPPPWPPQGHHGLCHLETERRGQQEERGEDTIKKSIIRTNALWLHLRHIAGFCLVFWSLVSGSTLQQHNNETELDFSPLLSELRCSCVLTRSLGLRCNVQRYPTRHHESFKVLSAFPTPALLSTPITVAGTACSFHIRFLE